MQKSAAAKPPPKKKRGRPRSYEAGPAVRFTLSLDPELVKRIKNKRLLPKARSESEKCGILIRRGLSRTPLSPL